MDIDMNNDRSEESSLDIGIGYIEESEIYPLEFKQKVIRTLDEDIKELLEAQPGNGISNKERDGLITLQFEVIEGCKTRGNPLYTSVIHAIPLTYATLLRTHFPEHLEGWGHLSSIVHNLTGDAKGLSPVAKAKHFDVCYDAINFLNSFLKGVEPEKMQEHTQDEQRLYSFVRQPKINSEHYDEFKRELNGIYTPRRLDIAGLHEVFEKGKIY